MDLDPLRHEIEYSCKENLTAIVVPTEQVDEMVYYIESVQKTADKMRTAFMDHDLEKLDRLIRDLKGASK